MIKIVKLITGEELIADITENDSFISLKSPCGLQLVASRDNREQASMALVPYAAYTEEHSIKIEKSNVIWIEKPIQELYNQYSKIFGSGIVLPGQEDPVMWHPV